MGGGQLWEDVRPGSPGKRGGGAASPAESAARQPLSSAFAQTPPLLSHSPLETLDILFYPGIHISYTVQGRGACGLRPRPRGSHHAADTASSGRVRRGPTAPVRVWTPPGAGVSPVPRLHRHVCRFRLRRLRDEVLSCVALGIYLEATEGENEFSADLGKPARGCPASDSARGPPGCSPLWERGRRIALGPASPPHAPPAGGIIIPWAWANPVQSTS